MEAVAVQEPADMYLVIESSRNQNIGTTLRCAVAFGAKALILVGSEKISTHGAHGSQHHINILHFFYWRECEVYLRSQKCTIKTIVPPSDTDTFAHVADARAETYCSSCAFILASKAGISKEQAEICDGFVSIFYPVRAFDRDVHYDVTISITLQHFASAMKFCERRFEGEKFCIEKSKIKHKKVQKMSLKDESIGDSVIDIAGCFDGIADQHLSITKSVDSEEFNFPRFIGEDE